MSLKSKTLQNYFVNTSKLWRCSGAFLFLVVAFCLTSCGVNKAVDDFYLREAKLLSQAWEWSEGVTIDSGAANVNYDKNAATCFGAGFLLNTGNLGCSQNPAIELHENQWLIGFPKVSGTYSLYSNFTSTLNWIFGSAQSIDDNTGGHTSRYVQYAKLKNGDVIAVWWYFDGTDTTVYSNVFSQNAQTWGTSVKLSAAAGNPKTDLISDGLSAGANKAILCRPSVATAGDGSAMVTWCEATGAYTNSQVHYRKYLSGGIWSPAIGTNPYTFGEGITNAGDFSFPGYTSVSVSLYTADFDVDVGGINVVANSNLYNNDAVLANLTAYTGTAPNDFPFKVDTVTPNYDVIVFRYSVGNTAAVTETKYYSYVRAVNDNPGANEFKIERDGSGNILFRSTLNNLTKALMQQKPYVDSNTLTPTQSTSSLSSLGFSMTVDDDCSDTACSSNTSRVVNIFYNKALSKMYFDSTGASQPNSFIELVALHTSGQSVISVCRDSSNLFERCYLPPLYNGYATRSYHDFYQAAATSVNPNSWLRSAGVSVAGDGYGNYAVARTVSSPYFYKGYTLGTTDYADGVGYARMLAGHEYSSSTGWKKLNAGVAADTPLHTSKISRVPACLDPSIATTFTDQDYSACSVRNPKFLMSNSGQGLVFFYQNQPTPLGIYTPSATSDVGNYFRNRLYVSSYSVNSGFGSAASIVDDDTYCLTSSVANDEPVCETGSYSVPCSTLRESQDLTAGLKTSYPINDATLDHDVAPIAASMNSIGYAVVAYNKAVNVGTNTTPDCYIDDANTMKIYGTYVKIYDPTNGFSGAVQIASTSARSSHVNVSINEKGKVGVVWEEELNGNISLYVRSYQNGAWSSSKAIVTSTSTLTDSLLPTIKVADSGEMVVSYSIGKGTGTRNQYFKKYSSR